MTSAAAVGWRAASASATTPPEPKPSTVAPTASRERNTCTGDRPLRERPVLRRIHEAATFDAVVELMADAFAG
jgi:hypothetical protein